MAKDSKGHGSNMRTSDRVLAAKGSTRREQHADVEKYEVARKSGDRATMAAESIKLSRRSQRVADTKSAVRSTTTNRKYT